jgi:hypothetical protein
MARNDRPSNAGSLKLWAAARAAGFDMRVLDDGDIGAGACPDLPDPAFNHAYGLRMMPQLLPVVRRHYDRAQVTGWIPHVPPVEGAQPASVLSIHAASGDFVWSEVAADELESDPTAMPSAAPRTMSSDPPAIVANAFDPRISRSVSMPPPESTLPGAWHG